MEDGQLFHMLTFGKGNMPSHAGQVAREDRWKVIVHVRQLQQAAVEAAATADANAETPEAATPDQADPATEASEGAQS